MAEHKVSPGGKKKRRASFALAAFLVVVFLSPTATAEDLEIRYAPDVQALKQQFRETGKVTLQVPDGTVTVVGTEDPLLAPGQPLVWELWETNASGGPDIVTVFAWDVLGIKGHVEGDPLSTATLLLGEFGVHGSILTYQLSAHDIRHKFEFDVEEAADQTFQQVARKITTDVNIDPDVRPLLEQALDEQVVPQNVNLVSMETTDAEDCSTLHDSYIRMDTDYSLTRRHTDWSDRGASAFQQFKGMWKELCIQLWLLPLRRVEDLLGAAVNCEVTGSAAQQYGDWIMAPGKNRQTGAAAFQLWTHRGFDDDAVGCAWSDSYNFFEGRRPTSVVEGDDVDRWDDYDPDETDDRGLISGQELGHIYGEQNHPDGCKHWWQCNIMKDYPPDLMDFYFVESSKTQIRNCFFYAICE